jgi:hypothetical protein
MLQIDHKESESFSIGPSIYSHGSLGYPWLTKHIKC